ncbi:MAG TPA: efflux transporter outer membrane subunit [Casimicrobiaceae bacterium]|nr:efflux transporter outer membrane subunit [Casimicrobiaceae bacterium]
MHRRLAMAVALALAGCMVGPDYQRPQTPLPATYADAPPAEAGPVTSQAMRADWWTLYEDRTLDELVANALSDNLDVAAAVARIEEFDADLREANAALFPEIDLGATAARSRSSAAVAAPQSIRVSNDFRIALSTSFEIDFWGRLRRLLESARAQVLATHYAKDVVTLSLAGLTSQTYFLLRSLDAQITATRETLETREQYLAVVRRRVDAGLASGLDLAQALGARSDAAAQLKELVRQRALAEHLLGTLTSRLDLKVAPGDLAQLPIPPTPPMDLPSTLLERRPDIRLAEANLVSANAQIGVAKAALLPRISLTGALGGESAALSSLAQSSAGIWSIGFALAQPIFTWGRLTAEVDATTARQKQALFGYQKSIQTAFREVSDALVNIGQTSAMETDLQASVDAARDALRLSTERYESGYAAYLAVLDAQRSLNISQLALIRNRQALLSASVDLMKALGGGWTDQTPLAVR